jgi:SAM-dependent methyltransferase
MARSRTQAAHGGMLLAYGLARPARAAVALTTGALTTGAPTTGLLTTGLLTTGPLTTGASQRCMRIVFGALLFGFVTSTEGLIRDPAGPAAARVSESAENRDRVIPVEGRHARHRPLAPPASSAGLFTQFVLDLAAQHPGRAITVLQAGCTTAGAELDLAELRARGLRLDVRLVDDKTAASRAAVAARPDLGEARLVELRSLPLRPRSFDIVQCSLLLHRVPNAEMVLWRLASAVRPGGLLLLRLPDPASAFGFLDRRLPGFVRTLAWRSARPGQAGPYPAVYERVASARGIEMFMSRHGLAVAHRGLVTSARSTSRPAIARAAARLVAWLSRGRLTTDHDELCYVIRRPEDRFARLLR